MMKGLLQEYERGIVMNTNWKSIINVYKLCKDLYVEDVERFKQYYLMTSNPIVYRSYSFTESARVKHLLDMLGLKYDRFATYDGPHVFIIESCTSKQEQIKNAVKQAQK